MMSAREQAQNTPGWELQPPENRPALTPEEAIRIALTDPGHGSQLFQGLPAEAEYGCTVHSYTGKHRDTWRVLVDMTSLELDMGYEGPGNQVVNGVAYNPYHVRVPKIRASVIMVDDKARFCLVSGSLPEPNQEHRIEWRRAGDVDPG